MARKMGIYEQPFENLSVMIIDGNPFTRRLLEGILRTFGVGQVKEAADPADAFRDLIGFKPHAIITELALKPITGVEFARMVRWDKKSPDRYVPIIMVTSSAEHSNVVAARDAGINEFVAAPVSAEALYAKLYAALYRQRRFIESKNYIGPDRRRINKKPKDSPERRRQ